MFELTDNLKKLVKPSCDLKIIAGGLARIGRFGGRGPYYYSVLAHSIVVGSMTSWPWRIYGYLHDMAEVIVGDVGHPFKTDEQKEVEDAVHNYMLEQLGIDHLSDEELYVEDEIRRIDKEAAIAEAFLLHLDEVTEVEGKPDCSSFMYNSVRAQICIRRERWFPEDGRVAEMASWFAMLCTDAIDLLEVWPST